MQFKKAVRKAVKLRLGITGPSGSGKTMGALRIAKGLGGRVAVIDTENDSAQLYADHQLVGEFDTLTLKAPFSPERYIQAIDAAEKAGFAVLIIDSITHEWQGSGGYLEIREAVAKSRFKGNSWAATSETGPRHAAFMQKILQSNMHIIATMRSKTETAIGEDKKVFKVGMKAEQKEGTEYEFTTIFDLTHDGNKAIATKDRSGVFAPMDPFLITEETGEIFLKWLSSGAAQQQEKDLSPIISELEQAANRGTKVLIEKFNDIKKSDEQKEGLLTVWKNQGEQLKAKAQIVDEEISQADAAELEEQGDKNG